VIDKVHMAARNSKVEQVDLLMRTSGEVRLSDFMVYECQNAIIYFSDKLWPEFSPMELLKSIYA